MTIFRKLQYTVHACMIRVAGHIPCPDWHLVRNINGTLCSFADTRALCLGESAKNFILGLVVLVFCLWATQGPLIKQVTNKTLAGLVLVYIWRITWCSWAHVGMSLNIPTNCTLGFWVHILTQKGPKKRRSLDSAAKKSGLHSLLLILCPCLLLTFFFWQIISCIFSFNTKLNYNSLWVISFVYQLNSTI